VAIRGDGSELPSLEESLDRREADGPPSTHLEARDGQGWWWAGDEQRRIGLQIGPAACALAAASAATGFAGRTVASFVRLWIFFDPQPGALRRASAADGAEQMDAEGANLAARLLRLKNEAPSVYERILDRTRSILGVPSRLEFRVLEETGRVYFLQFEDGLSHPVHQIGTSSGTPRMPAR
jgi:predicted ATPase